MYAGHVDVYVCFFFFNDTATTEIYTLSLHDALPILARAIRIVALGQDGHVADAAAVEARRLQGYGRGRDLQRRGIHGRRDRKSTRLNSSHANISYAVFCLKKKEININSPMSLSHYAN